MVRVLGLLGYRGGRRDREAAPFGGCRSSDHEQTGARCKPVARPVVAHGSTPSGGGPGWLGQFLGQFFVGPV